MEVYELESLGLRVFLDRGTEPAGALADCVHHHGFCELHILLESSCILQVGGDALTVGEGQFCLVMPNVSHATQTPPNQFRRLILSFEEGKRPAELSRFLIRWAEGFPVRVGSSQTIRELADRMDPEIKEFSREHNRALLVLILVELARCLGPVQSRLALSAGADESRSMIMDDFFNRHFAMAAGEETLASRLGLSRRQLDRVMHSCYGMGYQEKISHIRLEVSQNLLGRTDLSVQAVAERVGYTTASNFTVFFKRRVGMTPTQYRKSLQL